MFWKNDGKFEKVVQKKFASNPQQAEAFALRAAFNSFQIIRQDMVCLGKFHYEEMVSRYSSSQLKVAYKDTDSLLYLIETLHLYNVMASFKHLLDLSDYPQEHFLHDPTNRKVPLTMTHELQGKVLREAVCLSSKFYSNDYVGGKKQSAKRAQKSSKKTLNRDLFRNCLFPTKKVIKTMTQLPSHFHQTVVNAIDKMAISSFDD